MDSDISIEIKRKRNESDISLLLEFVRWGRLKMVRGFLEKNHSIDVNNKDSLGRTPLHEACSDLSWCRSFEIVKLLVQNGAKVNVRDNNGKTPVQLACCNRDIKVLQFLIQNGADTSIFNEKDKYGRTALHYAHRAGRLPLIKLLVENGANVDAQNNEGKTLLHEVRECFFIV